MRVKIFVVLLLFLLSCAKEGQTLELEPFIGGTAGVSIEFAEGMRAEVFDGGQDPFDVTVKVRNNGETDISRDRARVSLSGILPQEFNKLPEELVKNPTEDLLAKRKDSAGNIIASPSVYVDFQGLNHVTPITGARIPFILRADICYGYDTRAVSKLCVRRNLLNPAPGGICEPAGDKPSFASGAPIQIKNFKQTTRGSNKIGFSFEIAHEGTGRLFEKNSYCADVHAKRDKINVRVDTKVGGLSCTGLGTGVGTAVEGVTSLFEGTKLINCVQEVRVPGDYEMLALVEASYDYLQSATQELGVKSSRQ